jgi:hypothetical protein
MAYALHGSAAMRKPTRFLVLAIASSVLSLGSVARADTPKAGSNELRLEGSYLFPGISINGAMRESMSSSSWSTTSTETLIGAGLAYGRFLTDNLEIGTSMVALHLGGSGTSSSTDGFGLSPFFRFFTLVHSRIGVFGSATSGFQYMVPERGSNATMWTFGADAGMEFFVGDSWSLRLGPSYRYVYETIQDSSVTASGHIYGANWALAGYF